MTQQAPPAQQPQQQPAALAAQVAAVLAAALTAQAALQALLPLLAAFHVKREPLHAALVIVYRMPPGVTGAYGPATRTAVAMNIMRRAQFVIAASGRLNDDMLRALAAGEDPVTALERGMAREQRYYALHLEAIWNRDRAAAQTDSASMLYGRLLGWHSVMDARTSRECRAANGRNFLADRMPLIGYPGSVHLRCRCWPGRPFLTMRMLPAVAAAPPVPALAAA